MNEETAEKISQLLWQIKHERGKYKILQSQVESAKDPAVKVDIKFSWTRTKKNGEEYEDSIHQTRNVDLHRDIFVQCIEREAEDCRKELEKLEQQLLNL